MLNTDLVVEAAAPIERLEPQYRGSPSVIHGNVELLSQ